jgi:hypothetical protein
MDFGFDSLGSVLDTASSWLGNNKGWLKPVADIAGSYMQNNTQKDTRNNIADAYANAVMQDYEQQKAAYEAQQQAAASNSAAAAANERARMAAAKQALGAKTKGIKKAQQMYAPYVQAGKDILPQMSQTYQSGLSNLNLLMGYLSAGDQKKKLEGGDSIFNTQIPLPKA